LLITQVGKSGHAVGIDHIDPLVNQSIENVRKDSVLGELLDSGCLKLVVGDGRKGYEALGPYDAIHVGAAAPEPPKAVSGFFIMCNFMCGVLMF
jgi:protein-L-isoaspartate(D-aspartate) O-methyltransferase